MPSESIPPDWPLPDELLIELGRLAALWSALEAQLEMVLGKLAGYDALGDHRPFVVLKHTSFPQRLDMLSALCEILQPDYPHLVGYQNVVGQLRTVQSERNRFLHNGIARSEDGRGFVLAVGSARGKVKRRLERIDASDLLATSKRIHEAMLSVHKLVTRAEYPPIWEREGA